MKLIIFFCLFSFALKAQLITRESFRENFFSSNIFKLNNSYLLCDSTFELDMFKCQDKANLSRCDEMKTLVIQKKIMSSHNYSNFFNNKMEFFRLCNKDSLRNSAYDNLLFYSTINLNENELIEINYDSIKPYLMPESKQIAQFKYYASVSKLLERDRYFSPSFLFLRPVIKVKTKYFTFKNPVEFRHYYEDLSCFGDRNYRNLIFSEPLRLDNQKNNNDGVRLMNCISDSTREIYFFNTFDYRYDYIVFDKVNFKIIGFENKWKYDIAYPYSRHDNILPVIKY